MFDRIALTSIAAFAALSAGSCAATSEATGSETSPVHDASGLSPELAELVARPQTGSFNPEASKDAEFFKDTPEQFRPFIAVCNPWDEWDKPAPPFKVHGNTYYVGTCGIAAILIEGNDGHVLIDTGTRAGADLVLENITTLGFDPDDVKLMLHSHEHFDHVGGFAFVAETTGAEVVASIGSVGPLSSGLSSPDDPQHEMHDPMEPVSPGIMVSDGEQLTLGRLTLTAIETPGHTPGALSWQWQSCEDDDCKMIVYADSLSPVSSDDYKFSEHPVYLAAYQAGLERLARLDCDILLTPHPSHSQMLKRMRTDTMVEPTACAYYAIGKAQDIERRIEREAGANQ